MTRVGGIVLCGGRSSRMGRPKAWLPFGGELMLPRVVRLVSEAVSSIVVVASRGQELPPLPTDVVVCHDPQPDLGPLQGLAAGLAMLPAGTDAAYVSSCDVPLLRPAFVLRMIELLGAHQACVPQVGGYLHPLSAVYRPEVVSMANQLLAAGERSLMRLCCALRTRIATADELADVDPVLRSLRNVNTPEEYAALGDAQR